MTTKVERAIQVDVPLRTAYGQWTQFEDFPHFMGGVREVRQLDDRRLHWVAEIAGVRREWEAAILEQVPDTRIAWAATSGATNAGAVRFEAAGPNSTVVHLTLEYEPEGVVERVGDALGIVERQVRSDLERFKALVEDEGYPTGVWRGSINAGAGVGTPGVEDARATRGDSGKAGVSGTAVAAGAAAVVAGAAAVGAAVAAGRTGQDEDKPGPVAVPASERAEARAPEPAPVPSPESTAGAGVPSEVLDDGPEPVAQRTLDPTVGRDEESTAR
ncbi:SRPBCC family protein [Geodermatophilus sp. CPCC 205761]|uniref:SRPBCC family protein n=1 Tax=Geodermatophilus sp. CPCC 205761 TaxID=2936597 RepID=UPI003EEB1BDF